MAQRQHGVVGHAQLLACGLTRSAIKRRVAQGRLHRLYLAVYALGHRVLPPRGWWMAAVLACGDGAVLSHRAAACLWGLLPGAPATSDVTVIRSVERRRGIRPRRVRCLVPEDTARHDGIPVTSVARTLCDVAASGDADALDEAIREAVDRRLYDQREVERVLASGRPGVVALRAAVTELGLEMRDGVRLKSRLERRFRRLLRRGGFVLPQTNVLVATPWREWEVDALWPAQRIVVELDGWGAHRTREEFRRDHRRASDLEATGYRVHRLTWDQVMHDPDGTLVRIRRLLPLAD
nr:type IV toxin-antitoxin system AbiEi family antitoxin domain-containing protein [Patulibacter sp. SYSU D01012]